MAVVWGAVLAGVIVFRGQKIAAGALVGAVLVSHWLLDFVTHRPDLPVWPGGPEVGLGLWHSVPGTLLVEGALFVGGIEPYRRAFPPRDRTGRWSFWALVGLIGAIWVSGPWSPPPPSDTAIAVVGFANVAIPGVGRVDRTA